MLCDRASTNVAGAQPGFVNFVTLPIFNPFVKIFPVLAECVDQLKANAVTWKTYVETEEDKKVYVKPKTKLDSVIEHDSDCSFDSLDKKKAVKFDVDE